MIPASRSDSRCTLACIYCRRVRFSILLRHPRPWFLIRVSKSGHFSLGRSTAAQLQSGPTVPPYCSRSRRQTTTTQRSSSWAETTQRRTQQRSLISDSPLRLGSRGQRWHRHVWKWKPRFYPTVKCLSQAALPKTKMRPQQVCKRSSSIRRPAAFHQPEPMFSQDSITTSNCSCQTVQYFWQAGIHSRAAMRNTSKFTGQRTCLTRMTVRLRDQRLPVHLPQLLTGTHSRCRPRIQTSRP